MNVHLLFHDATQQRRLQFEAVDAGGGRFYLKNVENGFYVHPVTQPPPEPQPQRTQTLCDPLTHTEVPINVPPRPAT